MLVGLFIIIEPDVENVPTYKKSVWSTLTSSTKDGFIDKKNISTIGERAQLYKTTIDMIEDHTFLVLDIIYWRLVVNPKYIQL